MVIMVVLAALSFSVAGCLMKLSSGLTVFGPTALMFALVAFGTSLQTLAMRGEQMTVIYVMVLGVEAITALLLGTFLLEERASPAKTVGVGLVLAGVLFLRFSPP